MKKILSKGIVSVLGISVLAALLSGCQSKTAQNAGELYVYNWGEYIDDTVIEEFEKETGIKVKYDLFETNEEMYPVIEAGGVVYDVVCPSDYMIKKMAENGMLEELDYNSIPNIKNIGKEYLDIASAFDEGNKYSVPYCWGTVGILYNTSMVDKAPDSWNALWDEKYAGNILMQDSVRDAFMVGQKLLGYSVNTVDKNELNEVKNLLIEQKPLVQAYVVDQVRDKMIGGEAALAVIYSGEVLYTQGEVESAGEDWSLEYVVPKEGSNVWMDGWVIPKNAKNKENAHKWIDFLCRADIAKKNFEYITYSTPNIAAYDLLDEDMKKNPAVFPDSDILSRCEVYEYIGEDGDALYNELWKEVKSK